MALSARCASCMPSISTPFSRSASTRRVPCLSARPLTSSTARLPAAADDPRRLRLNRAPSSSAQSTSFSVTGGRRSLNIRSASKAAMTPSAPSSQPPLGTESRWPPMITVRSDSPRSVAQLLPAASIDGSRPMSASLPLNHWRASRHTGPQASRWAPSDVEVREASSLRLAMTSRALIARILPGVPKFRSSEGFRGSEVPRNLGTQEPRNPGTSTRLRSAAKL